MRFFFYSPWFIMTESSKKKKNRSFFFHRTLHHCVLMYLYDIYPYFWCVYLRCIYPGTNNFFLSIFHHMCWRFSSLSFDFYWPSMIDVCCSIKSPKKTYFRDLYFFLKVNMNASLVARAKRKNNRNNTFTYEYIYSYCHLIPNLVSFKKV